MKASELNFQEMLTVGQEIAHWNLSDVLNLTFDLQKFEGKDQGLARGIEYTVKQAALVCDFALLLPIYT